MLANAEIKSDLKEDILSLFPAMVNTVGVPDTITDLHRQTNVSVQNPVNSNAADGPADNTGIDADLRDSEGEILAIHAAGLKAGACAGNGAERKWSKHGTKDSFEQEFIVVMRLLMITQRDKE